MSLDLWAPEQLWWFSVTLCVMVSYFPWTSVHVLKERKMSPLSSWGIQIKDFVYLGEGIPCPIAESVRGWCQMGDPDGGTKSKEASEGHTVPLLSLAVPSSLPPILHGAKEFTSWTLNWHTLSFGKMPSVSGQNHHESFLPCHLADSGFPAFHSIPPCLAELVDSKHSSNHRETLSVFFPTSCAICAALFLIRIFLPAVRCLCKFWLLCTLPSLEPIPPPITGPSNKLSSSSAPPSSPGNCDLSSDASSVKTPQRNFPRTFLTWESPDVLQVAEPVEDEISCRRQKAVLSHRNEALTEA